MLEHRSCRSLFGVTRVTFLELIYLPFYAGSDVSYYCTYLSPSLPFLISIFAGDSFSLVSDYAIVYCFVVFTACVHSQLI